MSRPLQPGSLAAWLASAKVGDVYWTDRDKNGLHSQAKHAGRRITLKHYAALPSVGDDLQGVRLIRIEVVA